MFTGGYTSSLLRIDLDRRKPSIERIEPEQYRLSLGGRGLGAQRYWREVGPEIKPLSPENKIAFFAGPLTGVPLISTTKPQMTTKSPETGHYLCANAGGDFGPQLRAAGFAGLILEGVFEAWPAVPIADDEVQFVDAGWQGLTPMAARQRLLDQLPGGRWATMSIGPAAENGVASPLSLSTAGEPSDVVAAGPRWHPSGSRRWQCGATVKYP